MSNLLSTDNHSKSIYDRLISLDFGNNKGNCLTGKKERLFSYSNSHTLEVQNSGF